MFTINAETYLDMNCFSTFEILNTQPLWILVQGWKQGQESYHSPVHLVCTWSCCCNFFQKCKNGLILSFNLAWSHTLTFWKKHLCSEKLKFRLNYCQWELYLFINFVWTCVFHYINMGSSQILLRTGSNHHLYFFAAFLKKRYNNRIKSFSKSKWTGLSYVYFTTLIIHF